MLRRRSEIDPDTYYSLMQATEFFSSSHRGAETISISTLKNWIRDGLITPSYIRSGKGYRRTISGSEILRRLKELEPQELSIASFERWKKRQEAAQSYMEE